jgi:hypothetical protein
MFLFHALSRAFVEERSVPDAEKAQLAAPTAPQFASLALALLAVALVVAGGPLQVLLARGAVP